MDAPSFILLAVGRSLPALQLCDGSCQLLHGLLNDLTGGGYVEAHEADALLTEYLAVVERQFGLVDKEVNELRLRESQRAAVKPDEERGLGTERLDGGQVAGTEVDDVVDVALYVAQHLLSPLLTLLAEGCQGSDGGKEGGFVELVGREPGIEAVAQLIVGDDGVGADDTRNIEGLRGGTKGDAALGSFIAHRGEGNMLVAVEDHITMDFVADDEDAT